MMKKFAGFFSVMFVAMTMTVGCDAGSPGTVAVLDLDEVAKAIGWDEELNQALKTRGEALDERLGRKKGQFEKMIEENRAEMGDAPSDKQKQELVRFQLRANRQLQADLQSGQKKLMQYRSQLVEDFRDTLRPLAAEIAEANGMTMVVLKADPVFYVADPIDITDRMVERINSDAALKESLMIDKETAAADATDQSSDVAE